MDLEEIEAQIQAGTDARQVRALTGHGSPQGQTLRERYRAVMFYRHVDKLPNWEFGYWAETLGEWHRQGLPTTVKDEQTAYAFFGIERWHSAWLQYGPLPAFPYRELERTADYLLYQDACNATCRINLHGHKSIPQHLDFGLKTRGDWERDYRPRLVPDDPGRLPDNWPELAAAYRQRDFPLAVGVGSLIGTPRNWIGFDRIAMMVYDEPELLEEIVEHQCQVVLTVLRKVLPTVEFDFGTGWEDICFNSGPIVGDRFMREVVGPRYRRIADLLQQHGVFITWTDCDGNLSRISDVFVDNGYNCFFPCEVNGGTDPVALREKHGRRARFQGGFCKMKFLHGAPAVEAELQRLKPVVDEGGFIPGVDHRVQADAPLANYMYYLKRKRELFQVGGTPQYDESKVGLRRDGTVELPKL
jgi:uroporphyrinogen decarboxylase